MAAFIHSFTSIFLTLTIYNCRLFPRGRYPSTTNAPRLRQQSTIRAQITAERSSKKTEIDWDTLGFGIQHVADQMYVAQYNPETNTWSGGLQPYAPLQLDPAAQVLNYGQSVFEGMKAQRSAKGRIVLFRPDCNAERMEAGSMRMSMQPPPNDLFLEAVTQTVIANQDFVPPAGRGSLYLRPLILGTGPILGLGPAPSYTFLVYCAAVGAYFKGGQLTPIDLIVENRFHRAAPGGTGGTKCAGNYSPVLLTQLAAKKEGYTDVVYLDAKTDSELEEVSSCNIFMVKGKNIKTPPLKGTILPGVTRRSVIELARSLGYTVEEAPCKVDDAMEADELFTTGTAVVLSPVGSLTHNGVKKQYGTKGEPTPVALQLYKALTSLQQEESEDPFGWVYPVC